MMVNKAEFRVKHWFLKCLLFSIWWPEFLVCNDLTTVLCLHLLRFKAANKMTSFSRAALQPKQCLYNSNCNLPLSDSPSLLLFSSEFLKCAVAEVGQQPPWWSFTSLIANPSSRYPAPFLPSSVDLQPTHCCCWRHKRSDLIQAEASVACQQVCLVCSVKLQVFIMICLLSLL